VKILCGNIFLQLLIAVEYIHAHNVIHLDIKPGNILLFFEKDMTSYQIKLGDFGLMLKKKDWKIMHSDGGESGYLAPEVLTECDGINGSADIYSIGVLFFEMIGDYEIDYHFSEIKRIMDYSSFDIPNDNINLIKMMIDDNPLSRPTAYHLIQNTPQFKKISSKYNIEIKENPTHKKKITPYSKIKRKDIHTSRI